MGKKILHFFGMFAYIMCTMACVFSAIANKDWFAAICGAGLAVMAFPTFKAWLKTFQTP